MNEQTIMKTTKYVLKLLKLKKQLIKEDEFRKVSYNDIVQQLIIEDLIRLDIDWKELIKHIK